MYDDVGLGATWTCGARPGDVCWTCCVTRLSLAAPWRRMLGESREKPRRCRDARGVLFKGAIWGGAIWRLGGVAPAGQRRPWGPGVPGLGLLCGPSARRVQYPDRSPGLLRGVLRRTGAQGPVAAPWRRVWRGVDHGGGAGGDGTFPILFGYISYRIRIVLYLNVF